MALSNINIIRQSGGLARPPLSQDGISGLIVYGSSTSGTIKIFTPEDSLSLFEDDSIEYFHIKQYFDYSASALWVSAIGTAPSTFSEIVDLKDASNGDIRQYAILNLSTDYESSQLAAIQLQMEKIETEFAPGQAIYSADLGTGVDVEDLVTLRGVDSPRVSMVISEDSTDEVIALRATNGFVSTIGATLGNVSKALVHENIGWVSKFNIVTSNFADPAFIDGSLVVTKSKAFMDSLDSFAYLFIRKFVGSEGSYWNYSYTATSATDDFGTIENNRTYDKAFRNLRTLYLPEVNSPAYVDSDGKLSGGTIKHLETVGQRALQPLQDALEISAFSVEIDPNQNVLSTSKLEVIAKIIPVGVNKTIEVKLGFALSL
jgi:hypothetical protein